MWLKRELGNGSGAEGTPWEHGRLTRGYRQRRVLGAAGEHRAAPGMSTDKIASGSTHRTSRMLRKSYRMAAGRQGRNPGRTWNRTAGTSGVWTPSTREKRCHAGVPTGRGLTGRGKERLPVSGWICCSRCRAPRCDMVTRGEVRDNNSNRARCDLQGQLHFQTKPGVPRSEGAFLGLGGPPFPGCPAGRRAFWGPLGKGRPQARSHR